MIRLSIIWRGGRCHIYWMAHLFYVRYVYLCGSKHLFEFFSLIQCINSKVHHLYGHRETGSVITLQCTHWSLKWVFECFWNSVLIQLHCKKMKTYCLKNLSLQRIYSLQTCNKQLVTMFFSFFRFCTSYFHYIYEKHLIIIIKSYINITELMKR